MKTIKFIFIFLFLSASSIYSVNTYSEFYNLGYGNIANNLDPQYAINNSAILNDTISKYFTVSINSPFQLYSINITFPLNNEKNGLLFIKSDNMLNFFGAGIGVVKFSSIDIGTIVEIANSDDIYSISFSPQFLVYIFDNIVFGLNLDNIISAGKLYNYNVIAGLGLFITDYIRLFPGISYENETISWSAGLDIPIDIIRLKIGIDNNDILFGANFNIDDNYIFELSSSINFHNKNSDYSLSYSQKILLFDKKTKKRRVRRRISKATLNKQKKLVESGLDKYKHKDYESAYKIWNRAYRLAPSTKYGQEAKKYLRRVKNILRQLEQ